MSDHDRLVAIHTILDPKGDSLKSTEELIAERYTLEEAQKIINERNCKLLGHEYEIVISDYEPVRMICTRCERAWEVSRGS